MYAISKYGYPPSMSDTYKALGEMADMGFTAVELEGVREENLHAVAADRADLRKRCGDLGVRVWNFCPVLPDLVSEDPARRRHAVDLFRLGAELGVYFGASVIQMDSYAPPIEFARDPYGDKIEFGQRFDVRIPAGFSWERTWNTVVDAARTCTAIAKSSGLQLVMEPRVGEIVSNTDGLLRLIDQVEDPSFGVVFDTGHLYAQKEMLPLSLEKLGSRVHYVHASDNDGRENEHLAPGRGTIDWDGLLRGLRRHGYDGYIGIDIGDLTCVDDQYREGH